MAGHLFTGLVCQGAPNVSLCCLDTQSMLTTVYYMDGWQMLQLHAQFTIMLYRLVMGDVNVHDIEGMTPLHCAAHLGRSRHITLLNSGNTAYK